MHSPGAIVKAVEGRRGFARRKCHHIKMNLMNHGNASHIQGHHLVSLGLEHFQPFNHTLNSGEVEVVVYESKPEVSAAGEAIAIWKRSWQVFQDMGLDEELAKRNRNL